MEMGAVVENPADCDADGDDSDWDEESAQIICQNIELAEGADFRGLKVSVNGVKCCIHDSTKKDSKEEFVGVCSVKDKS